MMQAAQSGAKSFGVYIQWAIIFNRLFIKINNFGRYFNLVRICLCNLNFLLKLTLKAPRKKRHLKMLSAEFICCK